MHNFISTNCSPQQTPVKVHKLYTYKGQIDLAESKTAAPVPHAVQVRDKHPLGQVSRAFIANPHTQTNTHTRP